MHRFWLVTFIWACLIAGMPRQAVGQIWFAPAALPINGLPGALALSGGLNSAQFSFGDLDGNGSKELVVFDRTSSEWEVFVQNGTEWAAAPDLATCLPFCVNWALLRDYDGDGRLDLFTDNRGSVSLYKNVTDPNGHPVFELIKAELTSTSLSGGPLALYIINSDVPGLADVDGDGKLDFLIYELGGGSVEFHKNVSAAGQRVPTFAKNSCWGKFADSQATCDLFTLGLACRADAERELSSRPVLPNRPQGPMHMGHSVLPLDADGDGDLDLAVGLVSCPNVNLLINGSGAGQPATITSHTSPWPSGGRAASFQLFPAGYQLDILGNGRPSLLFAPNTYGGYGSLSPNMRQCVWRYDDANASGAPNYIYQTDAFLQKDMLDWGANAIPVWLDLDADSDLDLVIGADSRYNSQGNPGAGLAWYRNDGGKLTLADSNLGNYLGLGARYCLPFAADLNGDGATDLGVILPDVRFQPLGFIIHAGTTIGPDGTTLAFAKPDTLRFDFRNGDSPAFTDWDKDGDLDMVLGRDDGQLCLIPNAGTPQRPVWGAIQTGFLGYLANQSFTCKVAVGDVTLDGLPDVLVSTGTQPLRVYKNPIFSTSYTAKPDTLIYQNQTFGQASSMPYSYSAAPALVDWDGDRLLDITLGMGQGGIRYYENHLNKPLDYTRPDLRQKARILSNPSDFLNIWSPNVAQILIFDVLGRSILQETLHAGYNQLESEALASGLYWVSVVFKDRNQQLRWIKSK